MKKLLSILLLIMVLLVSGKVFATSYGDVKDNNDGTVGQILVNTGIDSGNTDIGHWTDPTSIPSLKGDKGDKGDIGAQGIQGLKGDKGVTGIQGIQGVQGLKGDKGNTGVQGIQGEKGDKGDTGLVGTIEANSGADGSANNATTFNVQGSGVTVSQVGTEATLGLDNLQTIQSVANTESINTHTAQIGTLQTGLNDTNSNLSSLSSTVTTNDTTSKERDTVLQKQVDGQSAKLDSLEDSVHKQGETKVLIEGAIRLYDAKRYELQVFNSYDARHGQNFAAGVRLLFKAGPSYEEKLIAKQQRDVEALTLYVNRLEDQLVTPAPAAIWFISSNGVVEKVLPKDPKYIKALLETKKK